MSRRETMTRFERKLAQREAAQKAEAAGEVADSMEVRKALMARFHSGEITLEQAQAELTRIKKNAKRAGLKTRDQFYR
jgi:hypothetical protein